MMTVYRNDTTKGDVIDDVTLACERTCRLAEEMSLNSGFMMHVYQVGDMFAIYRFSQVRRHFVLVARYSRGKSI